MLLTDDGQLASRVRYLATQARQPVVHYEHADIGYNYRLSNLLAALGRAQLLRLDEMISSRRLHRQYYKRLFNDVPGVAVFGGESDEDDNCWLTSILVDEQVSGFNPAELSSALARQNIESRPLWKPMHLQPVFRQARHLVNGTSEHLFETGLTLPSGSAMSLSSLELVESTVMKFLGSRV